jgi:hypothetical protein
MTGHSNKLLHDEKHGGHNIAESVLDDGRTFSIYLHTYKTVELPKTNVSSWLSKNTARDDRENGRAQQERF